MSNDPAGRRPRSADPHSKLRLAALAAVVAGVVLLAAAAFALSYEGIHQIALRAGVSPGLAKLYPLIFDAMFVVAAAAALALRGAGWWARFYAWASLLIVLAAVAVGNAVHATGTTLPAQPTKAAVAVIPWVLLLGAFGLLLAMLHYFRTTRAAAARATAAAAASGGKVRELPRVDLDTLLGPRTGQAPPIELPNDAGVGESDGHQADPVSYGEETGYVHPDSYLNEGEYSPHGDTGGPGSPAEQAGDNTVNGAHPARHDTTAAETPATPADAAATSAGAPATSADAAATSTGAPATSADAAATSVDAPASREVPATPAETPAAPAEAAAAPADAPASPDAPATSAEAPATSPEAPAAAEPAAGEAAPGAEDGQAAGADRVAAETPEGPRGMVGAAGMAGAGPGGNGAKQEAGAEGPALERIRSTPTRP